MAARNKRTRSPDPSEESRDSFGLYARASRHRDDLLEEARELQAAGRIREARAVEKRASQVTQLVEALESETRAGTSGSNPPPS
jgi:hypothetical protein